MADYGVSRSPLHGIFGLGVLVAGLLRELLAHFTMHPRNFSPHHTVTTFKIGEWHYNCVRKGNLDDCLADPSRGGVDAQGIVDGQPGWFGASGFAHTQGPPVGANRFDESPPNCSSQW